MRIRTLLCCVLLALACGLVGPAAAESCFLAWATNSCGGERMADGDCAALVSLGQLTIGENASGQCMAALGTLSAEQVPPLIAASPGEAKLKADGTRLALAGLVVSTDQDAFAGRIYAQAEERSSGIALVGGWGEAALAGEGSRVNVVGGMSTLSGERIVLKPIVTVLSEGDPPLALEMTNCTIGGGPFGAPPLGQRGVLGGVGLNNVGLLVRTTGLVIDDSHAEYILINDGCWAPIWESGLRVAKLNLGSLPEIGSYAVLNGISGVRVRGSVLDAIVKPRKAGDLDVLLPPTPEALMRLELRREEQ